MLSSPVKQFESYVMTIPSYFSSILRYNQQVGVFDTGYHRSIPEHAYTYPLPRALATKYRRYGFHGTSHKYVVEQAAQFLGKKKINAISFHLGLLSMFRDSSLI